MSLFSWHNKDRCRGICFSSHFLSRGVLHFFFCRGAISKGGGKKIERLKMAFDMNVKGVNDQCLSSLLSSTWTPGTKDARFDA